MEYRTEVINGICAKKNDFTIMYNTLVKLDRKWTNNHFLMVKCSKMLVKSSSNGAVANLNDICQWIAKYVGSIVDAYEVRSLIRYVHIIINEKNSKELGYCDLTPPPARYYDSWCSHLAALANRNLSVAKEKQSIVFQQQLEKITMLANATDPNKKSKVKKRKKKVLDGTFSNQTSVGTLGYGKKATRSHTQLPSIVHDMYPTTDSDSARIVQDPPKFSRKAGSKSKLSLLSPITKMTDTLSPLLQRSPKKEVQFLPPPYNEKNSAKPHFDNFTHAVVETQVKKHVDRTKQHLLTTQFPDLANSQSIDYNVASITRSNDSWDKPVASSSKIGRTMSFNDQVDEEFFGSAISRRCYVDRNGFLQETGVSKLVKEKVRFKLESEKLKNEVFATLGL